MLGAREGKRSRGRRLGLLCEKKPLLPARKPCLAWWGHRLSTGRRDGEEAAPTAAGFPQSAHTAPGPGGPGPPLPLALGRLSDGRDIWVDVLRGGHPQLMPGGDSHMRSTP